MENSMEKIDISEKIMRKKRYAIKKRLPEFKNVPQKNNSAPKPNEKILEKKYLPSQRGCIKMERLKTEDHIKLILGE